jgi:hypothetical protein
MGDTRSGGYWWWWQSRSLDHQRGLQAEGQCFRKEKRFQSQIRHKYDAAVGDTEAEKEVGTSGGSWGKKSKIYFLLQRCHGSYRVSVV